MENDSGSFESLLWVKCLIILCTAHKPLCEKSLTHLSENVKYFETLQRWTDWLRSCLAEEQKSFTFSHRTCCYTMCLTTQCASVISDPVKSSIQSWARFSSLTLPLAGPTPTPWHQWHVLHQHDFSTPSASILNSNLSMLNLVRTEKIIREINAAELLRAILLWIQKSDICWDWWTGLHSANLLIFLALFWKAERERKGVTAATVTEMKHWGLTIILLFLLNAENSL